MVQIARDVNAARTPRRTIRPMRHDTHAEYPPEYPPARQADVVDDYHGVAVADPYRWLEDAGSPETQAWVTAQNALTRRLLDSPERDRLRIRLEALYNFPRGTAPVGRGGRQFFSFNDGLRNQPVLYVLDHEAPDRPAPAPRVLLDPNALSPGGTVALTAAAPSPDGRRLAFAVSHDGSDRQVVHVRDVGTATDLPDRLEWAKFTELSWTDDGAGFYYTRFPEPGQVAPGDEHYFAEVRYHRMGEPQSADRLVFHRPDDREAVMTTTVSSDGCWLVITVFRGASDLSEVYASDLREAAATPVPVFTGFRAAYAFIEAAAGRMYFRTTEGAPNGRIVSVDVSRSLHRDLSPPPCVEVIAQEADNLTSARLVHRQIVAVYLRHASNQIRLFDLDGRPAGEVALPGLGSLSGMTGEVDDDEMYFRFSSFTETPLVYRFDFATATVRPWNPFAVAGAEAPALRTAPAPEAPLEPPAAPLEPPAAPLEPPAAPLERRGFSPGDCETRQVWYASKDGTRVSMFLVHARGLPRDGQRPVLLSAYGGFNISLTPQYDPANFVWLERGGVVAVPNLRGGGEYGEGWHRAGILDRKQNVFDDFISAAEWLMAEGYTTPARLAIEGGSNGGLLVGAALVQRPDLFGAVVCRVPVVDMLRYHRFTVGRFWIPEYGSADDPSQFPFLYAYSPLHHVRDGQRYPATLVMTADTDDRVDPGMAKKFTARLQAATAGVGGAGPILIRVETRAGHGAGKPVAKLLDEEADIHAFLRQALRLDI